MLMMLFDGCWFFYIALLVAIFLWNCCVSCFVLVSVLGCSLRSFCVPSAVVARVTDNRFGFGLVS